MAPWSSPGFLKTADQRICETSLCRAESARESAGRTERSRVDKGAPEVNYWVGIDVAKAFHWLSVLDDEGNEVLSRRIEATEEDLEALCLEIDQLGGERRVGIDLLG
jgi:hypothetical protein